MLKSVKTFLQALAPFLFLSLFLNTSVATAATSTTDWFQTTNDGWHFMIAPYAWLSKVSGDLTVDHVTKHLDVPFNDILKHLNFAAQGHAELGYGRWSLMIDPTYLRLSEDVAGGRITSQTTLIDGGVYYRLFSLLLPPKQYLSLELLAGGRYFSINTRLDITGGPTLSDDTQMQTPIVGGRVKYSLIPKAHFWLEGDTGGFHTDHVNNTWSSTAGFAYTVWRHIDLAVAYRILKIDYSKSTSAMNIDMQGPMLGIAFH